ncbi:MAG: UDP-2,3-diacylglucosamine diphosphatase [Candidatus Electryoneaceae bacterium]|nr:UDP-2,3-diacylglucosamine diphosphatase [Candidatus Electryoneaceae bacterium]
MNEYPSPALFLADCHLPLVDRKTQRDWTPRVVRFLREEATIARTIFLVGDIFDFWFEWRHSVPARAFPVLAALHELVRGGRQIIYLGGNHDGHVGKFLEEEVGLTVSRKPVDALIDGKRFHIIHGDGLAPSDYKYRILRSLVRWKPTETIYRLVHPDLGIWLAYKLSGISRDHFSSKDGFGAEPYREYARGKLDEGFHYVIIGHRHTYEQIPHPNGGYLAIGEWIRKGSYGLFMDDEANLKFYR